MNVSFTWGTWFLIFCFSCTCGCWVDKIVTELRSIRDELQKHR